MYNKIIIIGAGGHARVIADILSLRGCEVLGMLDDKPENITGGFRALGCVDDASLYAKDAAFVIGVGNNETRRRIAEILGNRVTYFTPIHPSAVIADDVRIGEGTVVMPGTVINTGAAIGSHCIINTATTIDHDCFLDDFVHLSPGVHLAGSVVIGKGAWLGIGAIVSNNLSICADTIVGAGAVVTNSIEVKGKYVGVPAKQIDR